MHFLTRKFVLHGFQNLFLYGYGAIFNFLAILVTALFKGMGMLHVVLECVLTGYSISSVGFFYVLDLSG
jgi:hypothetical protein